MIKPISISSPLAKNLTSEPLYPLTLRQKNGHELKCADPKALRSLVALMDMQAQLGGAASHFGGPSAFAELMSSVQALMVAQSKDGIWYEQFHFVNDAGHCENGLYALKALYGFADLSIDSLKGFRSIDSQLTGHGESHLFPEGVWISNGPLGSGLPQAQGLALADALAGKRRTTICAISDGACMEGEAREALAAIPGLAAKGKLAPFVLLISDNNTKLTGRIDEQAFSMAPSFLSLPDLGWELIDLENPHDLQACALAVEEALIRAQANPEKPIALRAHTIKGYGTKKTAESSSGAHGFPLRSPSELPEFLREIYGGGEFPAEFQTWINEMESGLKDKSGSAAEKIPTEKVQVGISNAMIKARQKGLPVFSISSDLPGSTGVASFQKEFPEATQDVGVAEANMISTAIGLSKCGYIPVVDTFSQFGVTKGALPLIMSALSQGPMICVFSHAGFQDAADGASHQALSYISMLSSIPHTNVYSLSCSHEAEALMSQAIESFYETRRQGKVPPTSVFFLGRENFPPNYGVSDFQLGKAQVLFDNTSEFSGKATIVAYGSLVPQALLAANQLAKDSLGCVVIHPSSLNHPDVDLISSCLGKTKGNLLTVDDHQLVGGMGSLLCHALSLKGTEFRIKSLGVKGSFGQSSYTALGLYEKHGLDAQTMLSAVKSFS